MYQPVPDVSRADVERVVRRDFDDAHAAKAIEMLDVYLSDSRESCRVQLAVLKLAAGRLDALGRAIETALRDYRDVLAGAEFPRYSREIGIDDIPASLMKAVIDDDWMQYESWLRR